MVWQEEVLGANMKITPQQSKEIFELKSAGTMTNQQIGKRFGVSEGAIRKHLRKYASTIAIPDIQAVIDVSTNQKAEPESTISQPIQPLIDDPIIRFLDIEYGQKRVSRANVDFVVGHARTTLQRRFGMNHARACEIMNEYCKRRGWIFEKPLMKMHISFKAPEDRRMWF